MAEAEEVEFLPKAVMSRAGIQFPGCRRTDTTPFGSVDVKTAEISPIAAELSFYQNYHWCLNPCPTVGQLVGHLKNEIAKLSVTNEDWRLREVMTNVFLLSCTLLNSVDDYLRGPVYRLPRPALAITGARFAQKVLVAAERLGALVRRSRFVGARRWRQVWRTELDTFLRLFVSEKLPSPDTLVSAARELSAALRLRLPADLQAEHIRMPSAFRKQDLTPFDVLALGRKFMTCFPDRQQPILVVGPRTAGAYFAPLLRAFMQSEGYQRVDDMSFRPDQGLAVREQAELIRCASTRHLAVLIDDPPFSGGTISLAVHYLRTAGFRSGQLAILFPVRPVSRDWQSHFQAVTLLDEVVLCLEPEEWHKHRMLAYGVEDRLREYYLQGQYVSAMVVASAAVDKLNAELLNSSIGNDRDRLKRIYAVRLETSDGQVETRHVLGKGVGWGVFGYSAFLAGHRLAGLVPPLLGLRDGILYTEWLPQITAARAVERTAWINHAASYVAARVRCLGLGSDPTPSLGRDSQHQGFRVLGDRLCQAYDSKVAAKLMHGWVRERLSHRTCPFPTLIDGKMSAAEWIVGPTGLLKTDFEHHGFGKQELNVTDPAYDLADASLQFGLAPAEEEELIRCYATSTGDTGVKERLFFNKLIAGSWAMTLALDGLLRQPSVSPSAMELNERYLKAWDFLTRESARFCGTFCNAPPTPRWNSSLVVLDIDGVLDRRIFGFPTTTAAGIQALRLLHGHGLSVAVNSARSAREIKEYCSAYGFVGGVAEYGSYVFDAVAKTECTLVSAEALEQLDELRQVLRRMPGVFLNDGYQYSIRAYTYERNGMVPLASAILPNVMSQLHLHRLRWHQTTIDTTIVAKDVDKGQGLKALLDWAGRPNLETIAIGDSEPDLAMFRSASRSFAPAHIDPQSLAQALGCQIAPDPYQVGLFEIARSLVHSEGGDCPSCPPSKLDRCPHDELFLDLLEAADRSPLLLMLRALLHLKAFHSFVRN
jgi:hydroxymethylpyrimidine pyrophosphatase-like HAD family hydrolase